MFVLECALELNSCHASSGHRGSSSRLLVRTAVPQPVSEESTENGRQEVMRTCRWPQLALTMACTSRGGVCTQACRWAKKTVRACVHAYNKLTICTGYMHAYIGVQIGMVMVKGSVYAWCMHTR